MIEVQYIRAHEVILYVMQSKEGTVFVVNTRRRSFVLYSLSYAEYCASFNSYMS